MAASETAQKELNKYGETEVPLPRIAIKFCVQCKWNLRAAYYAQELLSTFSTTLGEVSLVPATGGTFTITLAHRPLPPSDVSPPKAPSGTLDLSTSLSPSSFPDTRYMPRPPVTEVVIWDRKTDGGFPETKDLKSRVRNIIEPGRDLGHVDRSLKKAAAADVAAGATAQHVLDPSKAMPVKEISGGGVSGGTSPTLQEDEVMLDAGPTISASAGKCQDCQ